MLDAGLSICQHVWTCIYGQTACLSCYHAIDPHNGPRGSCGCLQPGEAPADDSLEAALAEVRGQLGLDALESVRVVHCAHAFAVVLRGAAGWKLVYSGDTRPCDALAAAAKDATVLIHEARRFAVAVQLPILAPKLPHGSLCCVSRLWCRLSLLGSLTGTPPALLALSSTCSSGELVTFAGLSRTAGNASSRNRHDACRMRAKCQVQATFEDELIGEAKAKRHSTTGEAVGVGKRAGAYRTILTHFSQRYAKLPVIDDSFQVTAPGLRSTRCCRVSVAGI